MALAGGKVKGLLTVGTWVERADDFHANDDDDSDEEAPASVEFKTSFVVFDPVLRMLALFENDVRP
jgi:hypothetical protein